MTTSKRKPVLPELTWLAKTGGDKGSPFTQATRELRAAEAVIRAARRVRAAAYTEPATGRRVEALCRSLDRLDALTRPTRRTP